MRSYLCLGLIITLTCSVLVFSGGCLKDQLTSCVKPIADTAYLGQAITFQSCSQNATSYFWDFGDGAHASTATATHTYSAIGTYTVYFIPQNSGGTGHMQTLTITVVYPGPQACIVSLPDSVFAGQRVNFTSCTPGATSCLWSFGDGAAATAASTTHVYLNPGTYSGALTAFNAGGQGSPQKFTIVVTVDPGSWTFQDTTYSPSDCYSSISSVFATTPNDLMSVSRLSIRFLSSYTMGTGTYQVVADSSLRLPSQVSIYISKDGFYGPQYTSVNGTGQTIQISTTQLSVISSRINAIGNGITLQDAANPSVTSPLNFNITTLR